MTGGDEALDAGDAWSKDSESGGARPAARPCTELAVAGSKGVATTVMAPDTAVELGSAKANVCDGAGCVTVGGVEVEGF